MAYTLRNLDICTPQMISDDLPIPAEVQIGDIIVSKYTHSNWALPWDAWHHAAIVSSVDPLMIIEASGATGKVRFPGEIPGPQEKLFSTAPMWGRADEARDHLIEMAWAKPIFPNPIREIDAKEVKRSNRKIISEVEARKRVVEYARAQKGEPYRLDDDIIDALYMENSQTEITANDAATKWDENEWYCALLVYKSFSRTITDMRLETIFEGILFDHTLAGNIAKKIATGFFVTPEDLLKTKKTKTYFSWKNKKYV